MCVVVQIYSWFNSFQTSLFFSNKFVSFKSVYIFGTGLVIHCLKRNLYYGVWLKNRGWAFFFWGGGLKRLAKNGRKRWSLPSPPFFFPCTPIQVVNVFVGLCKLHSEQKTVIDRVKTVKRPLQSEVFRSLIAIDLMDFRNCAYKCSTPHTYGYPATHMDTPSRYLVTMEKNLMKFYKILYKRIA